MPTEVAGTPLVPMGTVQARLSELSGSVGGGGKESGEILRKQEVSLNARSAAAAQDSPRRAQ